MLDQLRYRTETVERQVRLQLQRHRGWSPKYRRNRVVADDRQLESRKHAAGAGRRSRGRDKFRTKTKHQSADHDARHVGHPTCCPETGCLGSRKQPRCSAAPCGGRWGATAVSGPRGSRGRGRRCSDW